MYSLLPFIPTNSLIAPSAIFALNARFLILILITSHFLFVFFTVYILNHPLPLKNSAFVGLLLFTKIIVSDLFL